MATNDILLIDGVIDDLLERGRFKDRGEAFELFALGQVLKDWDLSEADIRSGWTDGRQDGGIDGFYVIVNGHCITDTEDFMWPKASADVVVQIVTCKHADKFTQATLDALIASLSEILNLSIQESDLKGAYSKELLACRARMVYAYRKLAPRLATLNVIVSYVSRGDTKIGIGVESRSRAEQIGKLISSCFNAAKTAVEFIGAGELVELYRKKPTFSLHLPFASSLSHEGTYVLLVKLKDYYQFSVDENGKLRRYLFESNVRDYMGLNRVNQDIIDSLQDPYSPNFWWLNNGVTILATAAWSVESQLHMENVQIVNGLQTTESVFRYFSESKPESRNSPESLPDDERAVMIKVIVTDDATARDKIIRATNNQTGVEEISLHATDKIQRDIEEALRAAGIFYDRRKNFYLNQGISPGDTITPMYLAAGAIALIYRQPWAATSLKQKQLRRGDNYKKIFDERTSLTAWPKIAKILKSCDSVLENSRPKRASEGFLKGNRYVLALLTLARRFGTFNYKINDLASLDIDQSFVALIVATWSDITKRTVETKRSRSSVERLFIDMASTYGIVDVKRMLSVGSTTFIEPSGALGHKGSTPPDNQFIESVYATLPPQPWKPGIHRLACATLNCGSKELAAAIDMLIDQGRLLDQRDGVLYGLDGSIKGWDPERVQVLEDGTIVPIAERS